MVNSAVVVVYGVFGGLGPPRKATVRRLGTGQLELPTLVTMDLRLDRRMAALKPPHLLRVGIGWVQHERPQVEVIEILRVHPTQMQRGNTAWFGVELATASAAPTEADVWAAAHPNSVPGSLWCRMFPNARFCR